MIRRLSRTLPPTGDGAALDAPKQHKHDKDDQNCAEDADTAMAEAVAIAAEAPAKSSGQQDDEEDDKDQSKRHCVSLFQSVLPDAQQ